MPVDRDLVLRQVQLERAGPHDRGVLGPDDVLRRPGDSHLELGDRERPHEELVGGRETGI